MEYYRQSSADTLRALGRDQRRREQHQDHRIRELGKKALDDA